MTKKKTHQPGIPLERPSKAKLLAGMIAMFGLGLLYGVVLAEDIDDGTD